MSSGGRGGNGKRFSKLDRWTVMLSNIRGYDSKVLSFHNIIANAKPKPNVIVLNETHFKGERKMHIPGYVAYNRNRVNKYMGGIATAIDNKEAAHALKVKEGEHDDEFLITRHGQFTTPINICNVYGEQEGRTTKDDILQRWNRIMEEIIKIEAKDEYIVLIGDMNKHVGDVIEGNSDKITFGGQLIRDLLKTDKYLLVNGTKKVVGGPHTRYDPADPKSLERRSCLGLVIVSKELSKHVEKLVIDKQLKMTPGRPVSKSKIIYTD